MDVVAPDLSVVEPPISDGAFTIAAHDLTFLALSGYDVSQWRMRSCPLGLEGDAQPFLDAMYVACGEDGLDDLDVRIKGSSAEFFSSSLKPMPVVADAWASEFEESYRGPPSTEEANAIATRWMSWMVGRPPPARRPFDSLFRLGVHRDASDIDLQLSSAIAVARAEAIHAAGDGGDPLWHPIGFIRDEYAQMTAPRMYQFAADQSDRLDRAVNVKVFGPAGPPDTSDASPVSSHFQDHDWRII